MDREERAAKLAEKLANSKKPLPILAELLDLVDSEDGAHSETAKSAIISFLDGIKTSAEAEKTIVALRASRRKGSFSADFLDHAKKACRGVMLNAWEKTIRSITGSFTIDGTVARCPECGSTDVGEGDGSVYEFTEMVCRACGYRCLEDEWQLERWYPL